MNIVPLHSSDIQLFDSKITSIIIANKSCNDSDYTIFDFSRFSIVESIKIGNDCFGSVKTFQIEGLNRLKTIKIGNNSFTQEKNGSGNDESKSFHILNCESLESIQIGTIGSESNNFYNSSFVIRGINMILNIVMIRSSKSTIHYIR